MKLLPVFAGLLMLAPSTAYAQGQVQDSGDKSTFGGIKIGADIDYRRTTSAHPLPQIASSIDAKKGGIGYRAHIGYDAQVGKAFVVGAEGGIGRGGKTLSTSSQAGDYTLQPRWTWDVSGRAGVLAAPSVLLYGRAGYSWLRVREETDFRANTSRDLSSTTTRKGVLYGGGIEAAVSPGVFIRAEFNRVNYGEGLKASKALLGISAGF